MDGGVRLVGGDILHLALIDRLRALNRFTQCPAAREIVADHAPRHTHLLRLDDAVVGRDDSRARRDIDARCARAHGVKEKGVEHVDALGDDDCLAASLHGGVAAGFVRLEIVPRHLHRLAAAEPIDGVEQKLTVDAIGRLPVGCLRRALVQRQEEIVHAQQAHLHAEVFQILLQAHGGRRLARAGGARQADEGLLGLRREDGRAGGADLVVEHLFAAQNKLGFILHGADDIRHVDDSHKILPFRLRRAYSPPVFVHIGDRSQRSRRRAC